MPHEPPADDRDELDSLRRQLRRERQARRHRVELTQLVAQTGGEVSRRGVAEVIADGAAEIFDVGWVMVAFIGEDEMIHFVHGPDVPDAVAADWETAPLEVAVPIADVLRGETRRTSLDSRAAFEPWPILVAEAERANISSLHVEAVPGGRRPLAVVALAWPEPHRLDPDERELLDELVDVATPAFERAIHTEAHRDLVISLQEWLLPPDLPEVERLELSTMYEAGQQAIDVGGDWYDVVPLDGGRSAIVIGDVVGHDVRAVAEMAQVRHVLAAHLIVTHDPAESLSLTDRYLQHRVADTMATALVIVVDPVARTLDLASAGHLPPVLARIDRPSEVMPCGLGPPIGSGLGGYQDSHHDLPDGAVCVAVTDGVVELRDESIDASLAAFCASLDDHVATARVPGTSHIAVDSVIEMLRRRVTTSERIDDAAAVVFAVASTDDHQGA